jgi:hypothetical protein
VLYEVRVCAAQPAATCYLLNSRSSRSTPGDLPSHMCTSRLRLKSAVYHHRRPKAGGAVGGWASSARHPMAARAALSGAKSRGEKKRRVPHCIYSEPLARKRPSPSPSRNIERLLTFWFHRRFDPILCFGLFFCAVWPLLAPNFVAPQKPNSFVDM